MEVVLPAYNAAGELSETVESVIGQTYEAWSLVVVDDGSTDDTAAIASRFSADDARVVVVSSVNSGLSAARNLGFASIRNYAQFTLFLDSDDVLEPDAMQRLVETLGAASDSTVGAHGLPGVISEDGEVRRPPKTERWGYHREAVNGWRSRKVDDDEPTGFSALVVWCSIHTPGQVLWRTAALRTVGPWKNMAGEDWEMALRLSALGDILRIPHTTLLKRERSRSMSSSRRWLAAAVHDVRETLASPAHSPTDRRIARAGEFQACFLRLRWARARLGQRQFRESAREGGRAARAFGALLRRYQSYSRST